MIRFCRALLINWRRAATSLLAFGISSVHAEIVTLDSRTHHLGAVRKDSVGLINSRARFFASALLKPASWPQKRKFSNAVRSS